MCGDPLGNSVPQQKTPTLGWASESVSPSVPIPPISAPPDRQPPRSVTPPAPTPNIDYAEPITPAQAPPLIKLVHSTGRVFHLTQGSNMLGRRSQSASHQPEIDLKGIPNDGVVSRNHARIYWDARQNSYMIMDNSSRNGTAINGAPLQPGIAYPLSHHAILQLGQENLVCFTVFIE